MAYSKQSWINGPGGGTPMSASRLNHMEDGIAAAETVANKGAANGYTPLDASAKIAAVYLPAYVDDVIEYESLAGLPAAGTAGIMYLTLDTGKLYRWSGSTYAVISETLAIGTTGTTAAAGNDPRLSNTRTPTVGTSPYDLSIIAFGKDTVRAAGTGDNPFGIKLQRACTITRVTFRGLTADASGNGVYKIQKNGLDVSGMTATVASTNQVAGGSATGTWAWAEGDILTLVDVSNGTTPGKGLVADLKGTA